jgi:hypothetical protein
LKEALTLSHNVRLLPNVIAICGDFPPISSINQSNGITHSQGSFGNAGTRNQKKRGMIFRFAGDLVMNWPGLPWVECDLLWDKKVEARIPFVEMSVVLVKVSYLFGKRFYPDSHFFPRSSNLFHMRNTTLPKVRKANPNAGR